VSEGIPASPSGEDILSLPMPEENDAGARTIGDYLVALLLTLWRKKANFDGKRPFGNSSWGSHLEKALIEAGYVEGNLDEDGYIERSDSDAADRLIALAITSLKGGNR
jgi:hypothetical protein